jgi:hypothetical protein
MKAHLLMTATLTAAAVLCEGRAWAEYDLYKNEAKGTDLKFNADVIAAWYNSNNSWFGNSEAFLGANTDNWTDIGIEPKFSFNTTAGKGTLFAAVSGVYTSTAGDDASGLTVGLDKKSSFTLEQGNVGWKAEDAFATGSLVEMVHRLERIHLKTYPKSYPPFIDATGSLAFLE